MAAGAHPSRAPHPAEPRSRCCDGTRHRPFGCSPTALPRCRPGLPCRNRMGSGRQPRPACTVVRPRPERRSRPPDNGACTAVASGCVRAGARLDDRGRQPSSRAPAQCPPACSRSLGGQSRGRPVASGERRAPTERLNLLRDPDPRRDSAHLGKHGRVGERDAAPDAAASHYDVRGEGLPRLPPDRGAIVQPLVFDGSNLPARRVALRAGQRRACHRGARGLGGEHRANARPNTGDAPGESVGRFLRYLYCPSGLDYLAGAVGSKAHPKRVRAVTGLLRYF